MNNEKGDKQISFVVSQEMHSQVKIAATKSKMTMNLWIAKAIIEALKNGDIK